MLLSEFDFDLPDELIAQEPLAERDASRMLALDKGGASFTDHRFLELPELLSPGDVLVINDTQVFPARLIGHRILDGKAGAQVEALLSKRLGENLWEAIARPGRALGIGNRVSFGGDELMAEVVGIKEDGRRVFRFECRDSFDRIIDRIGNSPLPPYIKRSYEEGISLKDPRYQTIYAASRGAIAAPTAGLHFTERVFERLEERGVEIVRITHHVGAATFQPVRVEDIDEHRIEGEDFEISASSADRLNAAKQSGRKVLAVGTTSTRALESAAGEDGMIRAGSGTTELYIHPGYRFKAIDGLITNFHLPKSSLLILVSALAGRELVMRAYRHAVEEKYRFYSYGDCMLIR